MLFLIILSLSWDIVIHWWSIGMLSYVRRRYISTSAGIKMPSQKCTSCRFFKNVCRCQNPLPMTMMGPTTLVAIAIAHVAAVAATRPPPLSQLPLPCRPHPFLLPATLIAIAIALAALAIALFCCPPPLLPLPLPTSLPLPSSLPSLLLLAHHPCSHCHCSSCRDRID